MERRLMGKMVSQMFSGKQNRQAQAAQQQARDEQAVALSRQQQEQAVATAETEASLGRARRTPRGRRLLIGDQGSTLG
jgi:hypothetical protein